ncbi:MAG: hypothetical protein EHM78_01980 [Myxococcaceae bacterium]|nr:MAG: hypothetical protein EHM78_01980 [Myxococcaceae bacterium]
MTTSTANYLAKKLEVLTIADASAWFATGEKFIFCIDHLEISASARYADKWVDKMEDHLSTMLIDAELIARGV